MTVKQNISELYNILKGPHICVREVPRGRKGKTEKKNVEVVQLKIPQIWWKVADLSSSKNPTPINKKQMTSWYIIIKLLKITDKEKMLKAARKKEKINYIQRDKDKDDINTQKG